jgi:hypothetical protein
MKTFSALVMQIPLAILGLFVVPFAMVFARQGLTTDGRPTGKLPNVLGWFDNAIDGDYGDRRGWWIDNCSTAAWFGWFPNLKSTDFLARYWWLAVRNPINNFKRFVVGADCTRIDIKKHYHCGTSLIGADAGSRGASLLIFTRGFWSLEITYDYGNGRGFYIQSGHKVERKDLSRFTEDDPRRMRGVTLEFNPYKPFN